MPVLSSWIYLRRAGKKKGHKTARLYPPMLWQRQSISALLYWQCAAEWGKCPQITNEGWRMSATAFRGKDFSTLDETDDHTSVSASLTDEDSSLPPPHLTEDVINVGGWTGCRDTWARDWTSLRSKDTFSQTTAFSYLNESGVRLHGWQLPSLEPNSHPIFQPTSLTQLLVQWEFYTNVSVISLMYKELLCNCTVNTPKLFIGCC